MNRRSFSLTLCAASLLGACGQSKPSFFGIDLTGADYGRDFRLADPDGKMRSLADFRGNKEFRVFYRKVPTGGSYAMDHTALTYVFDASGRLRLAQRHESSADHVAADLRILLQPSS